VIITFDDKPRKALSNMLLLNLENKCGFQDGTKSLFENKKHLSLA